MSDTPPLSGIKVMVIDDSNTIRKTAEIFLLQAGAQVLLAEDGLMRWQRSMITCPTWFSATS